MVLVVAVKLLVAVMAHDGKSGGDDDDVFEEMTCLEIIDGKGDYFPGLAPLAYAYLDHIGCDGDTLSRLSTYIELVRKKASGEAVTGASWIRKFIMEHPDYQDYTNGKYGDKDMWQQVFAPPPNPRS